MGMAAGQARLLSITARMTDNEMRSQLITNSKLRLADKSSEASSDYMKALNNSELTYFTYDDTGAKSTQNLTAGILLNFSELKNQYGLVNSSNQLMVSTTDKTNYEKSSTLSEFLACYDVPLTDNPKYLSSLKSLFGDKYENYMGNCSPDENASDYIYNNYVNYLKNNANNWVDKADDNIPVATQNGQVTSAGYNNWVSQMTNADKNGWMDSYLKTQNNGNIKGLIGDYIDKLSSPPEWGFGDQPVKPTAPDFSQLATAYNGSQCFSSVTATKDGIGHMEHNLAALIWGVNGIGADSHNITNSTGNIKVNAKNNVTGSSVSLTNYDTFGSTDSSKNLINALKGNTEYEAVQDIITTLKDLYCDVVNYLNSKGAGSNTTQLDSNRYGISSSASVKSETELYTKWQDFYNQLAGLNDKIKDEVDAKYGEQYDAWVENYTKFQSEVDQWQSEAKGIQTELMNKINNLPPQQIPDENDPKYEWYKNLWYRMGGISETKKSDNSNNYKELDSTLMNNSEWLQFALEHGVLNLEQVNFDENGSDKYPNIGKCDWVSIQYNNAADISSRQNDLAIAKAEVRYKNELNEIENKDKKYDQDLKKLDTEHNALQTEYDSVKGVIEKNVERSFKAFS